MFDQKLEKYFEPMRKKDEAYSLLKGISLAREGKLMEAAMQFKTALALEPDSLDILFNYGKVCYAIYNNQSEEEELKRDFKEVARQLFEMCVDKHPDFSGAYYYLGFFYLNGGLYQKCSLIWKEYLRLASPEKEEREMKEIRERLVQTEDLVSFERGYLAVMAGRAEEGLAILEPLLQKDQESWNILFFVGLAYRKKGEYEKAIAFFLKVLAKSPSQTDAMNELALCYAAMDVVDKSEKYFKKALLIKGEDAELLGNLAGLYIKTGRFDLAEECLERASQIAPEDEIIQSWQNELKKRKGSR